MKILLINPPRSPHNAIYDCAPDEAKKFVHRKLVGPPLGLLTIASAVKNHDVTVLDLKGECDLRKDGTDYISIVQEYLINSDPDVVGVSCITSEFPYGIKILETVKKFNYNILTVMGGLHVTLCPEQITSAYIDIACMGQAAKTFSLILQALSKEITFESIPDILIRKGEVFTPTIHSPVLCNAAADDFIIPDRSFLKRWLPTYYVGKERGPVTYLFTSLGCPYNCSFCSIWPQFKGKYFQREIDSIISELKMLDEYPAVRFADANTIVNVSFMENLFDRIISEGIKKDFIMDIRADTAAGNPDLIRKCARGGLKVVISGFESFRDNELTKYNKNSPAAKIEEAINIFHENGIKIRGNYVIPPDYVEKDFDELSTFANKHKVAFAGYTILTPMPGTAFYKEQLSNIIDHDLTKYNFFNCVMKTTLSLEKFYEQVGNLWKVRLGKDTI